MRAKWGTTAAVVACVLTLKAPAAWATAGDLDPSFAGDGWTAIFVALLASGTGAFVGAYLKKRGQHLATKEDFDVFLRSPQFAQVVAWGKAEMLRSRPRHKVYTSESPATP